MKAPMLGRRPGSKKTVGKMVISPRFSRVSSLILGMTCCCSAMTEAVRAKDKVA